MKGDNMKEPSALWFYLGLACILGGLALLLVAAYPE